MILFLDLIISNPWSLCIPRVLWALSSLGTIFIIIFRSVDKTRIQLQWVIQTPKLKSGTVQKITLCMVIKEMHSLQHANYGKIQSWLQETQYLQISSPMCNIQKTDIQNNVNFMYEYLNFPFSPITLSNCFPYFLNFLACFA